MLSIRQLRADNNDGRERSFTLLILKKNKLLTIFFLLTIVWFRRVIK